MTTRDVISTRAMLKELLRGPSSDRLLEIAHKHVMQAIDVQAGRVGRGEATTDDRLRGCLSLGSLLIAIGAILAWVHMNS